MKALQGAASSTCHTCTKIEFASIFHHFSLSCLPCALPIFSWEHKKREERWQWNVSVMQVMCNKKRNYRLELQNFSIRAAELKGALRFEMLSDTLRLSAVKQLQERRTAAWFWKLPTAGLVRCCCSLYVASAASTFTFHFISIRSPHLPDSWTLWRKASVRKLFYKPVDYKRWPVPEPVSREIS